MLSGADSFAEGIVTRFCHSEIGRFCCRLARRAFPANSYVQSVDGSNESQIKSKRALKEREIWLLCGETDLARKDLCAAERIVVGAHVEGCQYRVSDLKFSSQG